MKKYPDEKDIKVYYNGAVYLVAHLDITTQYIGSGKTKKLALASAQQTREELLKTTQLQKWG